MVFKSKLHSSNQEPVSILYYYWIVFRLKIRRIRQRISSFRSRRAHKSFRLTARRDQLRATNLPGYFSFNKQVWRIILDNRRIFLKIIGLFSLISFIFVGIMDQEFLNDVWQLLNKTNQSAGNVFSGAIGEVGKAGLLVLSAITTGGLTPNLNENQAMILFIIVLLMWLVVVQVCRNILAGKKPDRLRDIIYTAGAPIVNLAIIFVIIFIQAIPIFVAIIIWSAAKLTNLFEIGVEQMMFSVGGLLLVCISVYWIVGSLFAMIISTVSQVGRPIYPMQAIRLSGDMVVLRRLMILRRLVWAVATIVFWWMIIFIPMILILNFAGAKIELIKKLPILQLSMLVMASASVVFFATYIYVLYRRIVESD